jgi:hypothetical protein
MYAKNFLDNMKNTASTPVNKALSDKSRGAMMGSLIGGGVGLAIAYQNESNLLFGAFIGALVGGIVVKIGIDYQKSIL